MKRFILYGGAALLISACAHRQSTSAPASAQDGKTLASKDAAANKDAAASKDFNRGHLVCEMETPVGSHFPQRICHSDGDDVTDRNRQETQDGLRGAAQGNQSFGVGGH